MAANANKAWRSSTVGNSPWSGVCSGSLSDVPAGISGYRSGSLMDSADFLDLVDLLIV